MNGQRELTYGTQDVPEYVRDILTAGVSRLFLPVGFVEEGELLSGHFRTEGYRKLSSVSEIGTEDIFAVILGILRGVWQAERLYLFSEMYEIRPDCIYVDRGYSDVRLVFIPAGRDRLPDSLASEKPETVSEAGTGGADRSSEGPLPLTEKLVLLLEYLRKRGSREGWSYIDSAVGFLREDWGYKALVHRLEELRREIYLCSVK